MTSMTITITINMSEVQKIRATEAAETEGLKTNRVGTPGEAVGSTNAVMNQMRLMDFNSPFYVHPSDNLG